LKKIYISGKITGDPNYRDKFNRADIELTKNNDCWTYNPIFLAEYLEYLTGSTEDLKYSDYLKYDLEFLLKCDAIFMLADWKESEGAKLKHKIAEMIGLEILYQNDIDNETTL